MTLKKITIFYTSKHQKMDWTNTHEIRTMCGTLFRTKFCNRICRWQWPFLTGELAFLQDRKMQRSLWRRCKEVYGGYTKKSMEDIQRSLLSLCRVSKAGLKHRRKKDEYTSIPQMNTLQVHRWIHFNLKSRRLICQSGLQGGRRKQVWGTYSVTKYTL